MVGIEPPVGIGRSEGGPRWRRRVFELVSNSGTTVVWPALETNVVSKQKKKFSVGLFTLQRGAR